MKKLGFTIFLSAFLIGLISVVSCSVADLGSSAGSGNIKTEKRDVSGFTKINAGGAVTLQIDAQKEFSVEVQADDNLLSFIKTEVSGDTLKISVKDKISSKSKILVKISMPAITSLDVSGASGAVVSNVKADSIELEASGASKIKINGETSDLKIESTGASGVDAEGLAAGNAKVSAGGASNATVSVSNNLIADAFGASSIYYTGDPKNVEPKSSGASSIKQK